MDPGGQLLSVIKSAGEHEGRLERAERDRKECQGEQQVDSSRSQRRSRRKRRRPGQSRSREPRGPSKFDHRYRRLHLALGQLGQQMVVAANMRRKASTSSIGSTGSGSPSLSGPRRLVKRRRAAAVAPLEAVSRPTTPPELFLLPSLAPALGESVRAGDRRPGQPQLERLRRPLKHSMSIDDDDEYEDVSLAETQDLDICATPSLSGSLGRLYEPLDEPATSSTGFSELSSSAQSLLEDGPPDVGLMGARQQPRASRRLLVASGGEFEWPLNRK